MCLEGDKIYLVLMILIVNLLTELQKKNTTTKQNKISKVFRNKTDKAFYIEKQN